MYSNSALHCCWLVKLFTQALLLGVSRFKSKIHRMGKSKHINYLEQKQRWLSPRVKGRVENYPHKTKPRGIRHHLSPKTTCIITTRNNGWITAFIANKTIKTNTKHIWIILWDRAPEYWKHQGKSWSIWALRQKPSSPFQILQFPSPFDFTNPIAMKIVWQWMYGYILDAGQSTIHTTRKRIFYGDIFSSDINVTANKLRICGDNSLLPLKVYVGMGANISREV